MRNRKARGVLELRFKEIDDEGRVLGLQQPDGGRRVEKRE